MLVLKEASTTQQVEFQIDYDEKKSIITGQIKEIEHSILSSESNGRLCKSQIRIIMGKVK
jgi:hypothetical protein